MHYGFWVTLVTNELDIHREVLGDSHYVLNSFDEDNPPYFTYRWLLPLLSPEQLCWLPLAVRLHSSVSDKSQLVPLVP